jgi:hypothetical protein
MRVVVAGVPCTTGADATAPRPMLLDRVREALRLRHYSRRTEEAYAGWIRRYIFFHGVAPPGGDGRRPDQPVPL